MAEKLMQNGALKAIAHTIVPSIFRQKEGLK